MYPGAQVHSRQAAPGAASPETVPDAQAISRAERRVVEKAPSVKANGGTVDCSARLVDHATESLQAVDSQTVYGSGAPALFLFEHR